MEELDEHGDDFMDFDDVVDEPSTQVSDIDLDDDEDFESSPRPISEL